MSDITLSFALDYASVGWQVFPLHHPTATSACSCGKECGSPFKHPMTRNGLDDATADVAKIRSWWGRRPEANIGIATGERSGVDVLDVDGEEGLDSWDSLMADGREEIARSFMVTTPRGGVHVYLLHPGRPVPNSASRLARCIDVRGDGGYVVAPPSRSSDGRGWRQWVEPGDGWVEGTAQLAPMPEWMSPATRPVHRTTPLRRSGSSYANTALDAECGRVALAAVGQRNDTLNVAAFKLGTLSGAGEIDAKVVAGRLLEAARLSGLSEAESEATIASGLSKGLANPRRRAS
jgi:hypothetical protein